MNQRDQKLRNRSVVLSLLRSFPGLSQLEIADRAGLQPSTTSNLVRQLKEIGLVSSIGKRSSGPQGGKKADILALRPDYGYFGGIYLKEDEIIFGVVDFGGNIVARTRVSVADVGHEGILAAIIAEIAANTDRYSSYLGTGIAVSSVVRLDGEIAESLHFERSIPELIEQIRRRIPGLPVVVDNDANCAADWDYMIQQEGIGSLIHLQVQTSPITIGAGIVIGGEVYRGTTGAAGELLQADCDSVGERLADRIERSVELVAAFLDTEMVYVAGELDDGTVRALRAWAAGRESSPSVRVNVLDNPDVPVLGAALKAIRAHAEQLIEEA